MYNLLPVYNRKENIYLNIIHIFKQRKTLSNSMKAAVINIMLLQKHESFIAFIRGLNDEQFMGSINNKWSAGQQLQHIYLSVKPLTQALLLPRFVLHLLFGKANRPSKIYEALIQKYKDKLTSGGRATGRFIPAAVDVNKKDELLKKLENSIKKLSAQILQYKEQELDILILPHPLLGKITLREMMYFTIYHVEHHHAIAKRNLDEIEKDDKKI